MECNESINFTNPNFALTARTDNVDAGQSRYWYSYSRGHDWQGPCKIPNFDTPGTAARTDYLIDDKNTCTLFLTAAKSDGKEGHTFCVRTTDGGITLRFLSWIGPEPEGLSIMPASIRLSKTDILVATRRREGDHRFIAAYLSHDNGNSWNQLDNPVNNTGEGNPPAMIKLKDGRVCLVYGYREKPCSIRAKLSRDGGLTWGKAHILRNNGSSRDIGYPRVVQRPDGKIVAIYYFSDEKIGPERFIEATIWDPPKL